MVRSGGGEWWVPVMGRRWHGGGGAAVARWQGRERGSVSEWEILLGVVVV